MAHSDEEVEMADDAQQRLVRWLSAHPGSWTSQELADALGVTSRSVRNYVQRLNAGPAGEVVERTAKGYRLAGGGGGVAPAPSTGVPARVQTLLRTILTAPAPLNVYDLANELGVSDSTIDNDLARLRQLSTSDHVEIVRTGDLIEASGREDDQRRLMRRSVSSQDDSAAILSSDQLSAVYDSYDIPDITAHVVRALADNGLDCNDYTLNPLILDLVIATDRITDDRVLDQPTEPSTIRDDPRLAGAAEAITRYLADAYGVEFSPAEVDAVALLLASKTTLLRGATDRDVVVDHVGSDLVGLVRGILERLDEVYLVDLVDDAFVTSLALHVHNMLVRARSQRPQPNPLAAAIRGSHPLVHELAVFFCSELERATGVGVAADEVGFIAFHLGSALDRRRQHGDRVSISLIVPGYHDLAQRLAATLIAQVGDRAHLVQVIETSDPVVERLAGELVVTPLPISGLHPGRQVLISPLLNQADLDLIDAQVRSQQRRNSWMRLVGQLHELFHAGLFMASPPAQSRDDVLRLMCGALRAKQAVPDDFYDQVLQREALSPTAFNDIVAIPHTLGMPAERTSIAVATFTDPIDWAGTPVRLVLLVAFSGHDRNFFRDTFDQLVITLTEPRNVRRLVDSGTTFQAFIQQLSDLIQAD